jgi:hypothetical protein
VVLPVKASTADKVSVPEPSLVKPPVLELAKAVANVTLFEPVSIVIAPVVLLTIRAE